METYCPTTGDQSAANAPSGNPFTTQTLDLTSSAPTTITGRGYGVLYRREGSAPGGRVHITIGGSKFADLYPGSSLLVPFDQFTAERSENSVLTGNAKLIVLRSAGATFEEPPSVSSPVWNGGVAVGPSGALVQTANVTTNGPVLATDGVSLVGVSHVRVTVKCATAATAGACRLWFHDGVEWFLGKVDTQEALQAKPLQLTHDGDVGGPYGRIYAEVLSCTNTGNTDFTTKIHTWTTA